MFALIPQTSLIFSCNTLCTNQVNHIYILLVVLLGNYYLFQLLRTAEINDNAPLLQVCGAWDSSLWAEDMESDEADGMTLTDEMDCRSYNSSPVKRRSQQKFRGARGALNRSCSVPDSNNPPCVSTPPHGDISIPVSDLTEIGADEHQDSKSMWSNRLERLNRGKSCESYPHCRTQNQEKASQGTDHVDSCIEEVNIQDCVQPMSRGCIQDLVASCASCRELEMAQNSLENESVTKPNISLSYNYMTKSMLCLNEESQDEVSHFYNKFSLF